MRKAHATTTTTTDFLPTAVKGMINEANLNFFDSFSHNSRLQVPIDGDEDDDGPWAASELKNRLIIVSVC